MRALDLKLVRQVRTMWAQMLAIALVMACGVATLILAVGASRSLEETRAAYYERYRFGDVFATSTRAPNALGNAIAAIPGVAAVETRIVEPVLLDIADMTEPGSALVISLPDGHAPRVNDVYLRAGRLPEPGRSTEVAVNENFAVAHGFTPGSRFSAVMNGTRTTLTVTGVVLSPEYVYAIGAGDLVPDNKRFGILWMSESALAPLFDRDGAFNDVSLRLLPGASADAVIDQLDLLLARYGGTGAYDRADQMSNAFLNGELTQLQAMSRFIPPVFLAVSAFLINMILSRLIALEREQIGLLKAIGYSRAAVAAHYLKLAGAVAAIGVAIGVAAGIWLGRGLTELYTEFFSFPFLIFTRSPDMYFVAVSISVVAAMAGALRAVGQAFALPAAVAMRPPAPTTYRRLLTGAFEKLNIFSQLTTMALRHLIRHPLRSALTTLGASSSVALLVLALFTFDAVDFMISAIYDRTERQDATLSFASARPEGAVRAAARLPGVLIAEPAYNVPARLSHGHLERKLAISGKPVDSKLSRVLDLDLEPIALPESGLVVGERVAGLLDLKPGDRVEVAFLDGKRRTVDVPIAAVIQSYLGLVAYMEIDALARLAGTGPRVNAVHVEIDDSRLDELYAAVKRTPVVSAVALLTESRRHFEATMEQNIVIQTVVYVVLSVIIAFGVVYNSARIQLSERSRELATLRVLGFSHAEVARVLAVELGAIVVLAQPLGWLGGYLFARGLIESLASDLVRVPFVIEPSTFAVASLIVLAASLVSAIVVRRRLRRLDLISVLKTRE